MKTPANDKIRPVISGGHVPPQALDAEECVLAQMLLEKHAVSHVLSIIPSEQAFFIYRHSLIFQAIRTLSEKGEPVDIITVTAELRSSGNLEHAGGAHGITLLSTKVNSAVNIEYHCRIVLEAFIKRVIITTSQINLESAYDSRTDPFEILVKCQNQLVKLQEVLQRKKAVTGKELFNMTMKKINDAKDNHSHITGIPSGLTDVDTITAGWQDSDLIILAARPGMGKTTAAMKFLRNAVVIGKRAVGFFSLEMSKEQLMTKLIAAETKISAASLRKGDLQEHEWATIHHKCGSTIFTDNILIDDSAITLQEIRAKAITMAAKNGVRMIIVDYLQLVQADIKKGNREQEIASISIGLKRLAKELNMPVIALSQLSRQVENRPDKRPMLSDLRESGSIEQDADVVIFLYRPEYYKITEAEDGTSLVNTCDVIFAKHRNGALLTATVGCDMMHSDMHDLPDGPEDITPSSDNYNPYLITDE
ncbi:MAG: replicative helicase [Cytophagaceae bacterium]|jgi:replicative DNA helicase|nr:replicative helicase [Cytophagaceae bacterium]